MKHQIAIEGMTCGGCASRISTTIQQDKAVESAVIDYATRTGVVVGDVSLERVKELVSSAGYRVIAADDEAQASSSTKQSLWSAPEVKNLGVAAGLAFPVMILAMGPWHVAGNANIQATLTTIFLLGPARGFLTRAFKQLRLGQVTMDTLVTIGMLSAWLGSWVLMMSESHHLYFESAVMIGFFVLLGKTLEEQARKSSIGEVDKIVRLRPRKAWRVREDGSTSEVAVAEVAIRELIYVRPGDSVPVDGIVEEGSATFDESIVTGESLPVIRSVGDAVPSGAVNAGATGATIRVTRVGKDTTVEQIIRMIEDARMNRPPVQALADRVSAVFVPVVMIIAALTAVGWAVFSDIGLEVAIMHGLAVLVVACPCALGLATPVAWVAGLGRAARSGILVRSYEALEDVNKTTAIVFDKTGTLTTGTPSVVGVLWASDSLSVDREKQLEVLSSLLSALTHSSHPLARSAAQWIRKEYPTIQMPLSKLLEERAGEGVVCEVKVKEEKILIRFGRPDFVNAQNVSIPDSWKNAQAKGNPMVAFSLNGNPVLAFDLVDAIRDDAKAGIARLKKRGLKLIVASGDRNEVVQELVQQLPGIDEGKGDMRPETKRKLVEDLRTSGERVTFVGDGINDAPALAAANVGLAMASGTDIAAGAAGLVLQKSGISSILDAIDLSRRITTVIKQNFFWAFFYNVAAIPIAVSGAMTPMWAAGAMAMSSVSVVVNALRLRR